MLEVEEQLVSSAIQYSYNLAVLHHPDYRTILEDSFDRPVLVSCETTQVLDCHFLHYLTGLRGHELDFRQVFHFFLND